MTHHWCRSGLRSCRPLRVAVTLLTATALVALSGGIAVGASTDEDIQICHANNSDSNPYIVNSPSRSGNVDGHVEHTGPVWNPTLKANNISWGDIIPSFTYVDGSGSHVFPGLNWNDAGKAFWYNDCNLPPVLAPSVTKTNDADGNGTFTDNETAASAGADVPFKVTITNTSSVAIVVDTITDAVGATPLLFTCSSAVVGTTIPAGGSTTCSFTVAGYSPADGDSKSNTATATVHQEANPYNSGSGSDTSAVSTTVPTAVLSLTVVKTNDADGNATYSDSETATAAGADVPFKVTVTNNSAVAVVIDTVTDVVGATPVPFTCTPALVGTTIAAAGSATCSFTATAYSPADGSSKTNTAGITAHQDGKTGNTTTGGDTSVVATSIPAAPALRLVKTNDANANSVFTDSELSPAPGSAVPFVVAVTNTGNVPVVIDSLTDVVGEESLPFTCANDVVGLTLQPDATATCAFTLAGYAPADGLSKTNTATVSGHQVVTASLKRHHALVASSVTASGTSVVTTSVPSPPPLSLVVVKTNDADGNGTYSATETAPAPGQDVPFRAVVTNTSATTVALDGLTDVVGGAGAVPVTCAGALPTTLGPGASATCDFVLVGSSPAAGTSLTDIVTAAGHEAGNPVNTVSAQGTSTVITRALLPAGGADLKILKTGPAAAVAPGSHVPYTLTVTNSGTAPAASVVIDDALPANTTLAGITAAGWSCTGAAAHCVLNSALAPGGSASVTVTLTLAKPYAGSTVVNTAIVSPTDSTPEDNTSTATTGVAHAPDLSIVKTGPASVVAGSSVTWTLAVTNNGDAPAPAVTVTDALPAAVGAGTVTAVGWTCAATTSVSCTLGSPLAQGASASLTVTAVVPASFTGASVNNTGVVGPTDATPDDNTSTVATPVTQPTFSGGGTTAPVEGPPTTVTRGGGSLSFTGVPALRWALQGLALVLIGTGCLLFARRKTGVG